LPARLEGAAWTEDGTGMAIRHRQRPVLGLQFHPESILTESGYPLLAAFLTWVGLAVPSRLPTIEGEYGRPDRG